MSLWRPKEIDDSPLTASEDREPNDEGKEAADRTRQSLRPFLLLGTPIVALIVVIALIVVKPWESSDAKQPAAATASALSQQRTAALGARSKLCRLEREKVEGTVKRREHRQEVLRAQAAVLSSWANYQRAYYATTERVTRRQAKFRLSTVASSLRSDCNAARELAPAITTR